MVDYAILYDSSAYSLKSRVMGRQSAGSSLLQAIADSRPTRLTCYADKKAAAVECAQALSEMGAPRTGVAWIPTSQPQRLAEVGLLYRPDPGIGPHAWHRLTQAHPRAYSICGVTHTLSSHGPMSAIADYLTAPLESWDALICTSRVARDAVRYLLEQQGEYLRERLGANHFTLPQLPVIPLGVHTRHFIRTADERVAARSSVGLAQDEVAVMFAGRLVIHGKAHPLPMYIALEQAARGRKVALLIAGQSPSQEILNIFIEEKEKFCPSVRLILIDGSNNNLYRSAWAAADIFTSLADSIQETFGLTPLEAMASGLPVVVSDWNGYKDTVREGIDGFRIPTLTLPPGHGHNLANRFELNIDNFDYYSAYVAQLVAVDVEATAQAYRRLIDDVELRHRMGASGAQRAREMFDWAVIFKRYVELWEDLEERRRADPQLSEPLRTRRRPDRADPFSMFGSYPTAQIGSNVSFKVHASVSLFEAKARRDLQSTNFAHHLMPSLQLTEDLLNIIAADWTPYDAVLKNLSNTSAASVASALVWLAKVGVLDFKVEDYPAAN